MTPEGYCATVCKAACCHLRHPDGTRTRCPHLTDANACAVYAERFAPEMPDLMLVGWCRKDTPGRRANLHPVLCGRIERLLERSLVPAATSAGCCYANPQLLHSTKER